MREFNARYKVFSGKRYEWWDENLLKSKAERLAKQRRKNGFKARISKEFFSGSGKGTLYKYVVWSRL